ncbi:uncharacterized protein (DUF1778 family) [Oxalobacteraceae bacterium GrIS 1.18]
MTPNLVKPEQLGRTARLEARVTDEQKNLLQRAAALLGRSVSDFIISSAQEAALRTIQDYELVRLTVDERNEFVTALLNPPAPSARLKKAAKAYREKSGG